jgi:hypothetical protein
MDRQKRAAIRSGRVIMKRMCPWHQIASKVVSAIVVAGALSACTHPTLVVKEAAVANDGSVGATTSDAPGIPFYRKRGVCNRESVWIEPQYTLSLTIRADLEPPLNHTMNLSRSGFESGNARSLVARLKALKKAYGPVELPPSECPASLGPEWDSVANNPAFHVEEDLDRDGRLAGAAVRHNVLLATNTAKLAAAVDYTHVYYLNSISPWSGTAQVDAKLGSDGTLTEGSGQIQDTTWSTVLTAISGLVGDFTGAPAAAAALAPGGPAGAEGGPGQPQARQPRSRLAPRLCPDVPTMASWPNPAKNLEYQFAVSTTLIQHDHTLQTLSLADCVPAAGGLTDGNFMVKVTKPGAESDKDDAKTIQISGSVKLPDESGGKAEKKGDAK